MTENGAIIIEITNALANDFRAVLRAVEGRTALKGFKPRYGADRLLERLERGLKTHDSIREELLDEYCETDDEGRRLGRDGRGRVLYPVPPNGLDPRAQPKWEVEVKTDEGTERKPFGGQPVAFQMTPENEEAFNEAYEEVAQETIKVELHLVPEREFEKEGAVDWEAMDGDPQRGVPAIPFRTIRQLLIRGNQGAFEQEEETEEEELAEA